MCSLDVTYLYEIVCMNVQTASLFPLRSVPSAMPCYYVDIISNDINTSTILPMTVMCNMTWDPSV